jgi:hypothetical protein
MTIVKFVHEVSTNSEEAKTQRAAQTSVTAVQERTSDQPFSPNGNVSLFHVCFILNLLGDQQDSPNSLMLETPSIGGTRRNVTLDPNQVTANWNSPHTITSDSSVNIDSSTNSIIAKRASGLSIYLQGPREPLTDLKAARLLQHYIDHLASWV